MAKVKFEAGQQRMRLSLHLLHLDFTLISRLVMFKKLHPSICQCICLVLHLFIAKYS